MKTLLLEILKHLGILKNQVLLFSVIESLIGPRYAFKLLEYSKGDFFLQISSVALLFFTVAAPLGIGCFYIYAWLFLPGSSQEGQFADQTSKDVNEFRKKRNNKIRIQRGSQPGRTNES